MIRANEDNQLDHHIETTREQLNRLWEVSQSPAERSEVVNQMTQLDKQAMRLMAERIDRRSAAYKRATSQLEAANQRLDKAIRNVAQVHDALEAVAQGVELLAKVV